MAKPSLEINKTDLYQHYNLVNVYDGTTLMKSLSNIKPNHYYAEYTHKGKNINPPEWFVVYMEAFEKRFETRLEKKILEKVDQKFKDFAKLNNLKYE